MSLQIILGIKEWKIKNDKTKLIAWSTQNWCHFEALNIISAFQFAENRLVTHCTIFQFTAQIFLYIHAERVIKMYKWNSTASCFVLVC